jgi:xanthine dehydrogenase YagS FAD-binding subunit
MQAFEYAHPGSVKEAVALLGPGWADAEVLAGGTDLLSLMKDYVVHPKRVVNIKGIAELGGIEAGKTATKIGALVSFEELLSNDHIQSEFAALAQAAAGIASPQIRSMGTVGGDLCQRPRCWYFRSGYGLLALDTESKKSLVPGGDNRYHAILGNAGPAYFVSPSSLGPALVALGASVYLTGPAGARVVPVAAFFRTPTTASEREVALMPNEVLTHITIPAASRGMKTATYEIRQREALDWPLAAASVALRMSGGTVHSARVVLGHVAPVPWHAPAAEALLAGHAITEDLAEKAGEAAVHGAKPLSENGYKVQLARIAVKRALLAAAQQGA